MKTTQWLWSAVLAATVSACASQQAQTPASEKQPATGAAQQQVQKQNENGGQAKIDGAGIKLYKDRSMTELSLVDALKATGKKVGVFQFAGVECLSCIEESKQIEAMIKASPKGQDIAHIIVLTDFFKDYTDEEFKAFLAKNAPAAYPMFDEAKVWKHFATNSKVPDRATILAMNLDQQATISTKPGEQMKIVAAAEALVK